MKKFVCLFLVLVLCLSSFSFVFGAAQDVSDYDTHQKLNSIYTWLNTYGVTLNAMNTLSTLLKVGNTSVAEYCSRVSSYLVYNSGSGAQSAAKMLADIATDTLALRSLVGSGGVMDSILSELAWTNSAGTPVHGLSTIVSYLHTIRTYLQTVMNTVSSFYADTVFYLSPIQSSLSAIDSNITAFHNRDILNGFEYWGASSIGIATVSTSGAYATQTINFSSRNWRQSIVMMLRYVNNSMAAGLSYLSSSLTTGYNSIQSLISYQDPSSSYNFTPFSFADGVYKYLNALNIPLARLSYVLADDDNIEIKESSVANSSAALDGFLSDSGSGSVSPSNIGDLSSVSGSFKTSFNTGASASGVFDVFNSSHGSWFSQDIANSLDTTPSLRKSNNSYSTPLLDNAISQIYDLLGGDKK